PSVMTLDIFLPDIDGWRVLERLKNDMATRHIPVCVISTDEARERALNSGALTFVAKPIKTRDTIDELLEQLHDYLTRPTKSLLVAEPDEKRRERILACVDGDDVEVTNVATGAEMLQRLHERR